MKKVELLQVQFNEVHAERIEAWMEEAGKANTFSDAVHQLVDLGLRTEVGKNMRITDGDKLNFMMLRDIMKHLKVRDSEVDVDFVAEAIYGGHFWAPIWEMQGLFHHHIDLHSDVELVVDTLDMWDFIESGIEMLLPEEVERLKATNHGYLPKFRGFDGNNESALMSIAQFLVQKMKRFARFETRDFNSHIPTAETYRRMTKAFEPIRVTLGFGRKLSVDQIVQLLQI